MDIIYCILQMTALGLKISKLHILKFKEMKEQVG